MGPGTRTGGGAAAPGWRAGALLGAALLLGAHGGAAAAAPVADSSELRAHGGTVRLEQPRHDGEISRALSLERGTSLYAETAFAVKRVSIGDERILDVVVLGNRELQLVARQVGSTNVVLWDARNRPQAVLQVSVGRPYSTLGREIRRVLGFQGVRVESAGDAIVLSGNVPSAVAAEQALQVAHAYFPAEKGEETKIVNLLEVGGGQQVMLEVVIAEMSRDLTRRLGTNFSAVFGSDDKVFEVRSLLDGLTSVDERNFEFDLDDFELQAIETALELSQNANFIGAGFGIGRGVYELIFSILQQNGLGKILAEPTLVARSGETARFLAGGEVAIPVAQGGAFGSITIEFKEFGVGLGFTPTVLEPGRIHLQVTTEVSEVDFALGTAVSGFVTPGFRTRRASTAVELGDGQSFAVAGLLRDEVSEVLSEYPVLGEIPVLGALFRSSQFQRQESELAIIVTPRLARPLPPGRPPLPTDAFVEPDAFEFYLLGQLEKRYSGAPPGRAGTGSAAPAAGGGLIGPAGHRVPADPEVM